MPKQAKRTPHADREILTEEEIAQPFARRFDELVLRTFLMIFAIDQISEDQKLQIQLALRDGGCGVRAHN